MIYIDNIMSKLSKTTSKTTNLSDQKSSFVFGKRNYQVMIASIVVLFIGFVLMIGNTDIYSFTKTTVAPIVIVAGFALAGFSIFIKSKHLS